MRSGMVGEGAQARRFSLVGALSVFTYYALFYGLTEFAGLWYIASAFVAFCGYCAVNFVLQKYWAFREPSKEQVRRQLVQFTLMAVANWLMNTALLYVLVEYFHLWYLYAQMILTVVVSVIAYFILRRIFRTNTNKRERDGE